jgi:import inner membrane translocase subunit TIM21
MLSRLQTTTRCCARVNSRLVLSLQSTRGYAKHKSKLQTNPTASSLLSRALDQKQRGARSGTADTAGPFTLGIGAQGSLGHAEKVKKWSELSASGKGTIHSLCCLLFCSLIVYIQVSRTAAQSSNLTVILAGAGLCALLVYSLTSELFSKNSATVLYGEACDRIQASPKVC